jgi:nucleoside-diphosphate-sugar epimerase/aryl carrier-like protein
LCGDRITQATTLVSTIGSTEAFNLPNMVVEDPVNWEYFEWNPNVGIVMEPTGDDHLAELVIHRQYRNEHQSVFHNFPNFTEWRTNDLYEQHPTNPALWKYVSRANDVIVLSNGEKMNPVSFEKAVEGHPWVRGALVVGAGQFQTGLVIEPHYEKAPTDSERLLDELWARVEQANAQCPAHARVWQSMVTLATPTKPFKRSPKGSVMRKATYQLYEDEIKLLYDKTTPMNGITNNVELHNSQQIRNIIRKAVHSVLRARMEGITDDTNIFTLGVDSLQVMQLRRILSSAGIPCTARMVYENPSITLLSRAGSSRQNTTCACNSVSREERMSTMIHRYQCSNRPSPPMTTQPGHSSSCVLLIGSTGALGTHLLHGLLQNPKVNRVYCLNRSADAAQRQVRSFVDRGLDSDIGDVKTHPKVCFFTGSTSQENFGLSRYDYAVLAQHVDVVILNAWPVNFNTPLETFESVIAGTKRCVDFAVAAARRPHIAFVSSIASIMNFPAVRPRGDDGQLLVPEEFDPDNSLPAKQGYGESKHVAACILARAARQGLIEATVLRVGQLAGTSAEGKGVWNRHGEFMLVRVDATWTEEMANRGRQSGCRHWSRHPNHSAGSRIRLELRMMKSRGRPWTSRPRQSSSLPHWDSRHGLE